MFSQPLPTPALTNVWGLEVRMFHIRDNLSPGLLLPEDTRFVLTAVWTMSGL